MSSSLPTEQRVLHLLGPESVAVRRVPVERPQAGELVVQIEAATTCGTDLKVYRRGGHPTMLRAPCPFGHELSGRIAATGGNCGEWCEGDAVVLANSAPCLACPQCAEGRFNLCRDQQYLNGAYGEYLRVPERFVRSSIYRRPEGLAPEIASLAEPLACVVHGADWCGEVGGRQVTLLGGGPIGQMFVVELVHRGAEVVLADFNPTRLEVGRELGARQVVQLMPGDDHGVALRAVTPSQQGAPVVVEATGSPEAWTSAITAVRPGGTVVLFGGCAKGTTVPLDTHRVHYSELNLRGVYHHLPATFNRALGRLAAEPDTFARLIGMRVGLEGVEAALQRMAAGDVLKAVVDPRL